MSAISAHSPPSAEETRAALGRVLGSVIFERSARATAFLSFIVDETLAGRGDRLKGYTIAIAAFGKDDDFDPQLDPLVRVEARRLRQRLLEYYTGPGADDPVRIDLPLGQYTPLFSCADRSETPAGTPTGADASSGTGSGSAAPAGGPAPAAPPAPLGPPRRWPLAAAGAALLVAILFGAWLGRDRPVNIDKASAPPARDFAQAARARDLAVRLPRLVVLPVESLGDGDLVETTAAGLSEELNLALVAFGIVATASAPDSMLDSAALATLRDDLDAGYALAGSARSENDSLRFTFRLFETDSGTQLWTNAYDYPPEAIQAGNIEQALATIVASLMSSPFGPIYGHEIALVSRLPSAELDPYQCLLRFYGYARTFGRADHAESVACMQRAVLTEPDFDSGWGALSTLYLHEHTFGYTQQPDREPPLMRALEAVRRALDIDGSSRLAAITLPAIQLAAGNKEEYQRAIDRALAIEPSHPAVRAQVGYVLTIAGDWQRGVPMIEAALPLTADEPGWYYISFAFRGLLTESYADALDWSLRIDAPEWFFTPLTVAASAALAGRLDLAEREIERLLVLYPNFEREGRAQLAAMPLDDVLRSRLILGLSLAGMELG